MDTTIENTKKIQSAPDMKHIPSMLLDAQKGLPIEVEVIVGEVVRMARERGISVPVRVHGNVTLRVYRLTCFPARRASVRPPAGEAEPDTA